MVALVPWTRRLTQGLINWRAEPIAMLEKLLGGLRAGWFDSAETNIRY